MPEKDFDIKKEKPSLLSHEYRIQSLENHMEIAKKNNDLLKKIHDTIVGNGMGDIGMVKRFDDLENEILEIKECYNDMKTKMSLHDTYFKILVWVVGVLATITSSLLVGLILKWIK